MKNMNNDILTVLIDEARILTRVKELGNKISKDYEGKTPVIVNILRGGVVFMSDLIRHITIPLEIDFMSISSYGNSTESSGVVKIRKDLDTDVTGRHVIIVEDIVDSGLSLKYLLEYLKKHNPASVTTCVLLDKPKAHKTELNIEYVGFEVGNEFVVGYGLDFAEKYRNLPFIGILREEIYL